MAGRPQLPSRPLGILAGALVALVAALVLLTLRDRLTLATPALVLVVPGVIAAALGGRAAAIVVAVGCSLTLDFLFIPPYGQWKILVPEDVTATVVFVIVALLVGELTARESERRHLAEQRADELVAANAALDRTRTEQARMAAELSKLEVMEQVDEQRAALLRSVSHDLRTPLATIKGVSSDLRSDTPYDDETRAELLGLVVDEAERLDRLVANLLSMSRVEAGVLVPDRQAVDLGELIEACTRRLSRMLQDRRIESAVADDLPLLSADYSQLDQVITNLLENAARHGPPRSIIRVGARIDPADPGLVEVSVEDAGTGVLPTERTRIFEAFHRSDGSRSSGIGLAICKAMVEAHGGTIRVVPAPGGGARFVFTIPVLAIRPDTVAAPDEARAP